MTNFSFSPTDGLLNTTSFPQKPANETNARNQFQGLFNQLRDWINSTLLNGNGTISADDVVSNSTLAQLIAGKSAYASTTISNFSSGFWNLAGGFQVAKVSKIGNDVFADGLIGFTGTQASGTKVLTFPSGYWPPLQDVCFGGNDNGLIKMVVGTDGSLTLGVSASGYISLTGIHFTI